MTEIRPCTFEEIDNSGLLELYASECAISNLPRPSADPEQYKDIIAMDTLKILGYFADNIIVGFITVMIVSAPHYAKQSIASMESFFVHPEHRAGGAGIRLLKAAEDVAKECNAIGFMISAPIDSPLLDVLSNLDRYRMTNVVFIRGFHE